MIIVSLNKCYSERNFKISRIDLMKKIILACMTAVMLTFLSCSLFTQPEPTPNYVYKKIYEAQRLAIKPTHDFFDTPESLIIYPQKETRYTFMCCYSSSTGGMSTSNYNFEVTKNLSSTSQFYLSYNKQPSEFKYFIDDIYIVKKDSLLMFPVMNTVYYTAFRDIDGRHILFYQTTNSFNSCFQIFKEGLGLIYENINSTRSMDSDRKYAILSKVDGATIDITSILARFIGMANAFANLCRQTATVITISKSEFDSILVYDYTKHKRLFDIRSDTTFSVPYATLYELYLWRNGTGQRVYTPNYDSITVTGNTYKQVFKTSYTLHCW